jgi:hypothetical protein
MSVYKKVRYKRRTEVKSKKKKEKRRKEKAIKVR